MTYTQHIKNTYPNFDQWGKQFPWFSIGKLLEAETKKEEPNFATAAQKAAIFFNDAHRLHWLLQHKEVDMQILFETYKISQTQMEAALEAHLPAFEQDPIAIQTPLEEVDTTIRKAIFEAEEDYPDISEETDEPQSVVALAENKFLNSPIAQALADAAEQFKQVVTPNDTAPLQIESEPYHTIDYFASQGIKAEANLLPDDKLGHQLKSFTSWLKQMKRIPALLPETTEDDLEAATTANHSLAKEEIVTEAMARVLAKQGKATQAVSVLEKLSLLHPEKSHYFATLINQIKV